MEPLRLAALHELGWLDTPAEERFDRVVRLAKRIFDMPTVAVNLIDANRLYTKSAIGAEAGPSTPRDISFCPGPSTPGLARGLELMVEDTRTAVLQPTGRLNMVAAPALKSLIEESVADGRDRVVVDFSEVVFIDSSGPGP